VTTLSPEVAAQEAVLEAKRKSWLIARRKHLTSTDSPAILGKSPWSGPQSIFARKLGLEPEPEATERMFWGGELQTAIANGYAKLTGRKVAHVEPYLLARHQTVEFIATSLDAFQVDEKRGNGLLEIKNGDIDWQDEAPLIYQIQLQHELMVTQMPWGTLACLVRGNRLVYQDIDADPEFQAQLTEILKAFWQRLLDQNAPEDGYEAPGAREALQRLFPKDRGTVVRLPDELLEVAAEYDRLYEERSTVKQQLEDVEKRLEARANRIRRAMGTSALGVLPDGTGFSWKSHDQAGYEVAAKVVRQFRRSTAKAVEKALR
jgi:putative phage-type endonuclease